MEKIDSNHDQEFTRKTILILGTNPKETTRLRLDEEIREISMGLQRSKKRGVYILHHQWAVRPRDLHRALLDYHPQIVHFCGHGSNNEGLIFEDEVGEPKLIHTDALSKLFKLFSHCIECVTLNACYSKTQAQAISENIDYVIGMKEKIGDKAAIEFAVGFYDALGSGASYEFAFNIGCSAVEITGNSDYFAPIIQKRVMPITDEKIQEVIDGICRKYQPASAEHRRYINRLLFVLQQIPGILKSSHPYYLEALDKTWEWVAGHICEFEPNCHLPLQESLKRWINQYLSWRIKDLYRQEKRQYKNELSLNAPNSNNPEHTSNWLEQIPASNSYIPPTFSGLDSHIEELMAKRNQDICCKIEEYIEEDPDNKLKSSHVGKHPECNCQELCRRILQKNPPDKFSVISRDLDIKYQTVKSHWERKCKPLLQDISEDFGYSKGEE